MAPEAVLKQMIGSCLEQVRGNATAIADGSDEPEHLHQLRIGLRRLRSALRLFGSWSSVSFERWDPAVEKLLDLLGSRRDNDVLRGEVLPQLAASGSPPLRLSRPPSSSRVRSMLKAEAVRRLVLSLQAYADSPVDPEVVAKRSSAYLARQRLRKLEKRVRAECKEFATANDEQRHRLRRRFKRLRYGIELAGDLLPRAKRERVVARLKPLQDALGRYNDMCQAQAMFLQMPPSAGSWFAMGWASARRADLLHDAERAVESWCEDLT